MAFKVKILVSAAYFLKLTAGGIRKKIFKKLRVTRELSVKMEILVFIK